MKKFHVAGHVTVSCWTEVEAETAGQALEIAKSRSLADIHIDGGWPENECWHMDADGVPFNLEVEKQP